MTAAGTGANAAPGLKAPKPTLAFRPDGRFKVVQFNDTQDDEQTDRRTIELMERTLDAETPDFVVINGDVINGGCDTELEVKQALNHVVRPMESRQIPWAVTFGNHDEDSVARTGAVKPGVSAQGRSLRTDRRPWCAARCAGLSRWDLAARIAFRRRPPARLPRRRARRTPELRE